MPRFSVVIPTHSRADLLRHSLASALEQTFDDYEVIVSNNASTDHTEEVVAGFDDPRLRLVRTESLLSMVDHCTVTSLASYKSTVSSTPNDAETWSKMSLEFREN